MESLECLTPGICCMHRRMAAGTALYSENKASEIPVLHPTYEGMHYKESITEELLKELAEKLRA